jgi:hypothetical protein
LNLRRVKELQSGAGSDPVVILRDGQRVHIARPVREVADRLAGLQT